MKKNIVNPLTKFGLEVKIKLMESQKTQEWLIEEIKKETGLFVDSSLMNKVLTGRRKASKIVQAIKKILAMEDKL